MPQIKIAVAGSRKSGRWVNEIWDWKTFAERCSKTLRTNETLSDYLNMSKDRQTDIKDVGGFVGGHLTCETAGRTKSNIALRACLTLDIDHAPVDLWERFTKAYTGAAVCYSTHKHTPEKPRLRLVIPFDRDTTPEEYQAVSRKFCKDAGLLEYVDRTTHEVNRLFFWVSTSADGEFFYRKQEGEPLNVDEVLSKYPDWRDRSQWPTSAAEADEVRTVTDKVQDPTGKPGIIGAFCRTYTMPEAMEKFLSDVYEPCDTAGGDRYTYKGGSTSGGAILYDDKFLYSHHESDPASGQLCNAFDLVRLHRFGQLDSKAKPETPHNKLPSYIAMQDLCITDTETKLTVMKEKTQAAVDDFAGIESEGDTGNWLGDLATDRKGNTLNTLNNLKLIILNDEVLKRVRYDQFARRDVSDVPQLMPADGSRKANDEVLGKIALHIESKYGLRVNFKKVDEMLKATARERGFNPVKDFIASTQWDGKKRVETLLIDYLGARDNAVNREITRKWITAAVARVFNPGCAFQNVLTLAGPQGIGKSLFLRTLAGGGDWFCDTLCAADKDKKRNEDTQGAWIVELGELNGLSRSEWQAFKGYISRNEDRGRAAYAVKRTDAPRQYVFAATTNDTAFLREADKGNRRWWIVPVNGTGDVGEWITRLSDEVPQIWAEAYQIYLNGEDICNVSKPTDEYMAKMQWEYSEDAADPMSGMIDAFLDTLLPADWETRNESERRAYFRNRDMLDTAGTVRRDKICAVVYLCERTGLLPKDKGYKAAAVKFNAHMRGKSDWSECDRIDFTFYGRQRGYVRKPTQTDEDDI
ncbi:virulence-associated E family protein [Muribaculum sp.]|uniref:virulence-associated E family protein n=1 Tax=Muribaculum sp. TaxID=1918611 RepID=UPI0023D5FB34|nr:virulence-associated E family protein [Muribaculum sp.]MDE5706074.1 virulence-associated E family protein [Muribaculum sp.]